MTVTDWTSLATGIRLVATDLDGTLLRPDGSVSAFSVDTFARARAAGITVVFVTGRPVRWLPVVAEATGHDGIAICANGAVVLDLRTGAVLQQHPMAADALDEVVRTLRREVPGIAFAAEWLDGDALGAPRDGEFAHESGYQPRLAAPGATRADDIREVAAGHGVVKLLARVPGSGHDADSLLEHALGHVAHLVSVTHSNSDDVLLEMSAAGVTKGSTLATLAIELGLVADQVAAIGDMPNDVPMITWAGVGLAVRGAHPRVLASADAELPGPDEDGVARFVDAVLGAAVHPV